MIRVIRTVTIAGLVTAVAALSGCDTVFPFGAEDKINRAEPIPVELENARKGVAEEVTGDRRQKFEAEWKRRMSLRALTCSKNYAPAWYTSVGTVREKLTDKACFADQDADTAIWVGYLRIGIFLAKPATRPIPTSAPKVVSADEELQSVKFSDNAGVAVAFTSKGNMLLIDLANNEVIRRNKTPEGTIGTPSPNGQLIAFGSPDHSYVAIYSTETGERVAKLAKTREWQINWLGDRGLLIVKDDSRKVFFIDFATGKETVAPLVDVTRVFPVPGQPGQYVAGTWEGVAKLALMQKGGETQLNVLEERKLEGVSRWSSNMTHQTADGALIVNASQATLSVLDIQSLTNTNIDFGPGSGFHGVVPTPDPDKVLVRTNAASVNAASPSMQNYVLSLTDKTLASIQTPVPDSLIQVRALKSLMTLKAGRLVQVDIPTATDTPIQIQQIALERRIADAERKIAIAEQSAQRSDAGFVGFRQAAPTPSVTPAPLTNLVSDARIEAVGVYQGNGSHGRSGQATQPANVEVRIRRSDKPLVLVLSSYEAVRWQLVTEPGARLAGIFVSGYKQSSVVGAGSTRVVSMGQKFAYAMNGKEFRDLDDDFYRLTGRHISLLQGRYEGNAFSVGGQL